MAITLEICCGSSDDALVAAGCGIRRIELNAAMALGGLTPSPAETRIAKEAGLEVLSMLRPREAGFCYTQADYRTMLLDAEYQLSAGADGLVFGFLSEDGRVDEARCREMMGLLKGKKAVFHRALDVVPDWREALDVLIGLGFARALTSGQRATAPEGAETLREMCEYAKGRIEILPGGGIRPHNIRALLDATGCDQAHASAHAAQTDSSTAGNPRIRFGVAGSEEQTYKMADAGIIEALLRAIG